MRTVTAQKRSSAGSKEPPLVRNDRTEIVPTTGRQILVTSEKRGLLATETRRHDGLAGVAEGLAMLANNSPRKNLEKICEDLRDDLDKCHLPSDRSPWWVEIAPGEWQPFTNLDDAKALDPRLPRASWKTRLDAMTEPLTVERCAGQFLYRLVGMLRRGGNEEHLWDTVQVLSSGMTFRTAAINAIASQGVAGRKARKLGPKARQERANDAKLVIVAEAEKCWSTHWPHKGCASSTAGCIEESVNQVLRTRSLLPAGKDRLSNKTITDYVRAISRG